jgi:hypothetical protein
VFDFLLDHRPRALEDDVVERSPPEQRRARLVQRKIDVDAPTLDDLNQRFSAHVRRQAMQGPEGAIWPHIPAASDVGSVEERKFVV